MIDRLFPIRLSHCTLLQDPIGPRNRKDYSSISDYERPYQYTIISNDKSKVWSLVLVRCLGPEPKFLLNGRGDGFNSPLEAAQSINNQLAKEPTTSA